MLEDKTANDSEDEYLQIMKYHPTYDYEGLHCLISSKCFLVIVNEVKIISPKFSDQFCCYLQSCIRKKTPFKMSSYSRIEDKKHVELIHEDKSIVQHFLLLLKTKTCLNCFSSEADTCFEECFHEILLHLYQTNQKNFKNFSINFDMELNFRYLLN